MKDLCEKELFDMITEINKFAKFINLENVKDLFRYSIRMLIHSITSQSVKSIDPFPERMQEYLKYYIKASSVHGADADADVLNKRNFQCFIDKLMEVYKMNDSTEDLATAVSKLLKRINENSVTTSLPGLL